MLDSTKSDRYDFKRLFTEAVKEALEKAVERRKESDFYRRDIYNFPSVSWYSKNGMPSLGSQTFGGPEEFGAAFTSSGKYNQSNIWDGPNYDPDVFPAYNNLISFIESNTRFRNYFKQIFGPEGIARFEISHLISQCLDKIFHDRPDPSSILSVPPSIIDRVTSGIFAPQLRVSAVVPIALTKFAPSHFRISSGVYLFRMGNRTHLQRARVENHGSGASKQVVSAATHAFVLDPWRVRNDNFQDMVSILNNHTSPPYELIDKLLAAVRMVTGIETGYSQVIFLPRGWEVGYLASTPTAYGTTIRKYPAGFDNYAWSRENLPVVTSDELFEIGSVYRSLIDRQENKIALAVKRLNACMTRDEVEDAIVDATIGLEILLGDDDPQATSYKLRMRAAALARLSSTSADAAEITLKNIARIYKARSDIVHGNAAKKSRAKEITNRNEKISDNRALASDALRSVLTTMLRHPKFIDVKRIDTELLLGQEGA